MKTVPVVMIRAGLNDRTRFGAGELDQLAESIQTDGLAQPIILRPSGKRFEIVAGERRFRAILKLGWTHLRVGEECMIRDLDDEQTGAIMLAENTGRVNLDPMDEARAFQHRIDEFGWTVEGIAIRAGVSPVHVQFRLKLLKLRAEIQHLVSGGQLAAGYAQTLADANLDPNRQMVALRRLQSNPNPTPVWFRSLVRELALQQDQEPLLEDLPLMAGRPIVVEDTRGDLPADPRTDAAPATGATAADILRGQIAFWTAARDGWSALGKIFKRQECEAVIKQMESVLAVLATAEGVIDGH